MNIQQDTKFYNDSYWLKVFYHYNPDGKNGFQDENEALYCINNKYKYSILSSINYRYKIKGLYEFIIEYPELGTYNRWQQKENPIDITEDLKTKDVEGFNPIETFATSSDWGGLAKATNDTACGIIPTLLNGAPASSSWHFSVGQYKNAFWYWNDTTVYSIPSNSVPVSTVVLWLRLPKIRLNTCEISCNSHKISIFTFILLLK